MSAEGGTFQLAISAPGGCAWAAEAIEAFLTIDGPRSGSGSGSLQVRVSENTGGERNGTLKVGSVIAAVTQRARQLSDCAFNVEPGSGEVPARGGTLTFAVTVTRGTGCAWTAGSSQDFITIIDGSSGTGDGKVVLLVAPNRRAVARTGVLDIAGRSIPISQEAEPENCAFAVTPLAATIASSGGTVAVDVTVARGSNCEWTASVLPPPAGQQPFMSVTSGSTGTGDGKVVLTLGANTGAERTAKALIAGEVVTVTQPAAPPVNCEFSVTPRVSAAPLDGGTVNVNVTVTQGTNCAWTAAPKPGSAASIVSGASGVGNGTVVIAVPANPGTSRYSSLTIAGSDQIFVYQPEQPGACVFSVTPQSFTVTSQAQTVQFAVTRTQGLPEYCQYSVGHDTPNFVNISALQPIGATITVTVSIAANQGSPRTTTVYVTYSTDINGNRSHFDVVQITQAGP